MDRDLQKKVFTLFSNQRAARGLNSFSKSGPSCEKLIHPCSKLIHFNSYMQLINLVLTVTVVLHAPDDPGFG